MQKITSDDAIVLLEEHKYRGFKVDERLYRDLADESKELYRFHLADQNLFLSLIWQEIDGIRILANGGSRTLKDIVDRMTLLGLSIDRLGDNLGLVVKEHNPEWFLPAVFINKSFNYSAIGFFTLRYPNDAEKRQSPNGTYYLHDGNHKAFVLAARLLTEKTIFQQIEAILIKEKNV